MTIIQWIRLAIITWSAIAGKTPSTADDKISAELLAALDEYEKVHGTEVTKVQVDALRTVPKW